MNNGKKHGIGLVGIGAIAPVHAEAITELDNARLVSLFSRKIENTKELSEKYYIPGHDDYNNFLADTKLDVVSICTPSGTHLNYAILAAKAGKHVIIEKPVEADFTKANEIINVCKEYNVKLAVIYQNRFLDASQKLKLIIEENKLGKIFSAKASVKWYRSPDYYNSAAWRGTKKLDGGGVLINQAIHTIDLLYWFMGDVENIYAKTGIFTHSDIEGEDNAVAVLNFKSGALGLINASTSIQPAQPRRIEIHGELGTAILNGDRLELNLAVDDKDLYAISKDTGSSGAADPFSGFSIEPHKRQFEQIINSIDKNETPVVSGEESLKSLAIVTAIYESVSSHRHVNMDEFLTTYLSK